ncbi:MAG TPA: sugar phosphate isomerase/epimerase family protein [Ktedonobacteraceae bacterium]|nr:sugar phosphate isomerase/epimerase family protein [Ktedonobacteraceae bacterium]
MQEASTTRITQHPLAFSTLACPDWSWEHIVQKAVEYGYQGIELRGVEGEMDLTKSAPFTGSRLATTKRELQERGLAIPCLDTSCRFDQAAALDGNIDEGKRHIDLAAVLEASYIRVFGDRVSDNRSRETILAQVIAGLNALAQHAEGTAVQVLLESHGDFADLQNMLPVMQAIQHPHVGVLWDVHHPYRFFSEPLAETYNSLKSYIRHVHLKDSITANDGVRYCLMGQGIIPLAEVLRLLRSGSYAGWLSFEWEKRWHPEIETPEVALPDFVRVLRAAQHSL